MKNYHKDEHGVIRQTVCNPIQYDQNYVDVRYNTYGELTNYMSHLRLGYIIGSTGDVPDSILDVGYGNGSFLKTCSQMIPNCYGHDVSGVELPEPIKVVDSLFIVTIKVMNGLRTGSIGDLTNTSGTSMQGHSEDL